MAATSDMRHVTARGLSAALLLALAMWPARGGVALGQEPVASRQKHFIASQDQPVKVEFVTEHECMQRGGHTRIGILFDIEKGWHIYAEKPGDAGLPTTVVWGMKLDLAGVEIGPLHWLNPEEFIDPGDIRTFGYKDRVLLWSDLRVTEKLRSMTVPLTAKVSWLACKEICIPGSAELNYGMVVQDKQPLSADAALFPRE